MILLIKLLGGAVTRTFVLRLIRGMRVAMKGRRYLGVLLCCMVSILRLGRRYMLIMAFNGLLAGARMVRLMRLLTKNLLGLLGCLLLVWLTLIRALCSVLVVA